MQSEQKNSRAVELHAQIARSRGQIDQVVVALEDEDLEVLVLLHAKLVASHGIDRIAPSVQAIIDRRLHREQVDASRDLQMSMEGVSATLERVERLQSRVELVGIAVAVVGTALAALQLWAALRTDPMSVVIVEDQTGRVADLEGSQPAQALTK